MATLKLEKSEGEPYRGGTLISYLRPYNNRDPKDYLKFDKYYSLGEWKQHKIVNEIRDIIKEKTTKEVKFGENVFY